ncbi:hypothetical protein RZS28_04880 [Methylocapsa polymorpha]|uniref:Uncharacterized protein n=1 Tax=Methylocapsa polymorpha TaxID=3080828 RepID=A0ABZ0HVN7_9HYPH|nr:hypothetical protein RZS28_04880 [Methylocapsa sp. RX1]
MSESWGVVSFWAKLWVFGWLLMAQFAGQMSGVMIGRLFARFKTYIFLKMRQ